MSWEYVIPNGPFPIAYIFHRIKKGPFCASVNKLKLSFLVINPLPAMDMSTLAQLMLFLVMLVGKLCLLVFSFCQMYQFVFILFLLLSLKNWPPWLKHWCGWRTFACSPSRDLRHQGVSKLLTLSISDFVVPNDLFTSTYMAQIKAWSILHISVQVNSNHPLCNILTLCLPRTCVHWPD